MSGRLRSVVEWLFGDSSDGQDTSDGRAGVEFNEFNNPYNQTLEIGYSYLHDYIDGDYVAQFFAEKEELDPRTFRALDALLVEAEDSVSFSRSEVCQFRELVVSHFDDARIADTLLDIYDAERESFEPGLGSLFEERGVDEHYVEYEIRDEQDPVAMKAVDGSAVTVQSTSFTTTTVEMQRFSVGFDLAESKVVEPIQELVRHEARVAWEGCDVNMYAGTIDADDVMDAALSVEDNAFADTLVLDSNVSPSDVGDIVPEYDVIIDQTGEMQAPFVVGDSARVGKRFIRERPTVDAMDEHAFDTRYVLWWSGNYEVTDPDAVVGPSLDRNT